MSDDSSKPYIVISSDTHCGADLLAYKPYLERRYHEDFDAWATTFQDAWGVIDDTLDEERRVGVSSYGSDVNWNSSKRQAALEAEGISAEVCFPNTTPPFFPSGMISAPAPAAPPRDRREYELRFAGLRAHNRWLADFCRDAPGRRAGLAQVFISDIDDTLEEIRRAHADGLSGVLLPPDHFEALQSLYYPRLDAVWALVSELGIPIGRHGVSAGEANSETTGTASAAIGMLESFYFSQRPLLSMVISGVFDRHPDLKFVVTELGASWVPGFLTNLDAFVHESRKHGTIPYMFASDDVRGLRQLPSDYFREHCFVGSFLTDADIRGRYEVGVDKIMWGADYPHHEGTSPLTRKALRLNFAGMPDQEVRLMAAGNAARVYGLDMGFLQGIADRVGPTVEELHTPLSREEFPSYPDETVCVTFNPEAIPQPNVDRGTREDTLQSA
jgi:predicted TIM-barrel fold metal-dependent hydrolase